MILLCAAAITAALVIFYYVRKQLSYWSSLNVDGPTPLPFFGNMLPYFQMKKHFGEVYDDIYKSFPNARYVGFYMFGEPSILVRSLDMTRMVMLDHFKSFQANNVYLEKKLDPLLSMNPFFVRGAEWKKKRSQLTPIFTASKVKSTFPIVKGICDRFADYIEQKSKIGHVFEAKMLSTKFTIESVASCAFGLEANAFSNEESTFVENTRKIFEITILQAIRLAATFFLPIISKLMKLSYLHRDVDPWIRSIINQVVEKRDETNEKRSDFLQSLLDMRDRTDAANYNESTIVGHSLSFLTDGYETSSVVMAYCFFQLAVNPEVFRKAQEEVDTVMRMNNGILTDESLKSMVYVEGLIYETLRLCTPDFSLNKLCTEDITLPPQYPDSGESGVTIKAGTPVIIPIYSIHRNPAIFKDPLKFDPDRWLDASKTQQYKYSFLAFGEGPRMCPGIRFGMMQSMASVATVLSKFNIEIAGETKLPLTFSKISLTLTCEDGIWLRFIKRQDVL